MMFSIFIIDTKNNENLLVINGKLQYMFRYFEIHSFSMTIDLEKRLSDKLIILFRQDVFVPSFGRNDFGFCFVIAVAFLVIHKIHLCCSHDLLLIKTKVNVINILHFSAWLIRHYVVFFFFQVLYFFYISFDILHKFCCMVFNCSI